MQANLLLYSHLADIELIHKVKAGRNECFETLVRRHNKTLYRIACSFGLSASVAEDLMVSVYTEAYPSLQQFDIRHSFRSWIAARMVAACQTAGTEAGDDFFGREEGGVLTANPTAASTVLERGLSRLPVAARVPLVLCEIEGFSAEEAASLLQEPAEDVAAHLREGRGELQDLLLGWYFGTDVYTCSAGCSDSVADRVMSLVA